MKPKTAKLPQIRPAAHPDSVISHIVVALQRLPRPLWGKPDDEERHWPPLPVEHLRWFAEEYLAHLTPMDSALYASDRDNITEMHKHAEQLLECMRKCRVTELYSNYAKQRSEDSSADGSPTFGSLERSIEGLVVAVRSTGVATGPGRKLVSSRAVAVAYLAARHFQRITGKEPTRISERDQDRKGRERVKARGLFPDLVEDVFMALGIKESVDASAGKAIASFEAKRAEFEAATTFEQRFPDAGRIKIEEGEESIPSNSEE